MKILVIGSGGREHALCMEVSQRFVKTSDILCPGNAGTAELGTNLDIDATNIDDLCTWCANEKPDLVVIGPEAPLCAGLTDRLETYGINVFGPNKGKPLNLREANSLRKKLWQQLKYLHQHIQIL